MAAGNASPRPNPICATSKVNPLPFPLPLPRPAIFGWLGRGTGIRKCPTKMDAWELILISGIIPALSGFPFGNRDQGQTFVVSCGFLRIAAAVAGRKSAKRARKPCLTVEQKGERWLR